MPVLFSAPTLIITDLKKAFAVFGLMPIRPAICFVLRSWSRRSTVSLSRLLSRNFRATLSRFSAPRGFLSSKRATVGPRRNSEIRFHRERPKLVAPLSRRDFIQKFRRKRNRYDGRCGEAGTGSCSVQICRSLCSSVELPDKRGSPGPLHLRRLAGGKRPEGETPRLATLRARYLKHGRSHRSHLLHEESDP